MIIKITVIIQIIIKLITIINPICAYKGKTYYQRNRRDAVKKRD